MTITNFTVRFHRNLQPAKYEEAGALVEFNGNVPEGEDAGKVSAQALMLAKKQVLAAVGLGAPAVDTPDNTATVDTVEPTAEPLKKKVRKPRAKKDDIVKTISCATDGSDIPADPLDPKPKPLASDSAATVAAKEEAMFEASGTADTKGGVVPVEEEEDFDAPPAAGEISDAELQAAARNAAKRVGGPAVRVYMKDSYGVDQLSALEADKRAAFVTDLETLEAE